MMSKITLFVALVLLFAVAHGQRSRKYVLLVGVCALGLCVSRAEAQSQAVEKKAERTNEQREHESRFDLAVNLTGLAGNGVSTSTRSSSAGVGLRATYYLEEGHFTAIDAEVNRFAHSTP